MYVIESKYIRDVLEFRIKSLKASGHEDIVDCIMCDIREITRHEIFIPNSTNTENIFVERVKHAQSSF